jgi:arylsulfatase A-like enzyme
MATGLHWARYFNWHKTSMGNYNETGAGYGNDVKPPDSLRAFFHAARSGVTGMAVAGAVLAMASESCLGSVPGASETGSFGSGQSKPDIVIIMADDLGFSDLGSYGGEIQTPNLDKLAENGLRFTQFYNAARCVPTRGSLLTGLYPHQAGLGRMINPGEDPGYRGRLMERGVTMAEVLRETGYQTFLSGKWHVTHFDYDDHEASFHRGSWPLQRGFDRFFGYLSGAGSYYEMNSLMKGETFIPSEPESSERDQFYLTEEINDYAVRFIREAEKDRPLYLHLMHFAPHWPLHALPGDIEKYRGVYDAGWDEIRSRRLRHMVELGILDESWELTPRDERIPAWEEADNKEWEAHRMAVYAAMVDNMDRGIGRVLEALRERGRFDNTFILFLSDNGASDEEIGGIDTRHGYFERGGTRPDVMPGGPDTYASYGPEWAHVSNTPFRLYKKWSHEGGIATPLIAHWPDKITDAGALRHEPGHIIDIMATVVDISGARYPEQYNGHEILPMEGVSLVPAFENRPLERETPLFFEHLGHRAVRDGKWKLVSERGKPWELYDMEADRSELNNLADKYPERAAELKNKWEEWADRAMVNR